MLRLLRAEGLRVGSGYRNSVLSSIAYEGMGGTGTLVCGYKRGGLDQGFRGRVGLVGT